MSRKYVQDYVRHPALDDDKAGSRFFYVGDYYYIDATTDGLKKIKVGSTIAAALFVAFFVALGMINSPCARQFYVSLPYVGILLPLMFFEASVYALLTSPKEMTRKQRDHSVHRAKTCVLSMLILCGIMLAGSLVFIVFFSKESGAANDWLYAVTGLLFFLLLYFFYIKIKHIKCIKKE